jgi:hypothetical protein
MSVGPVQSQWSWAHLSLLQTTSGRKPADDSTNCITRQQGRQGDAALEVSEGAAKATAKVNGTLDHKAMGSNIYAILPR